ncbi:hypothetical protein BH11PSE11_BH11PSE11_12800 [soil metagenome]
MQVVYYFHIALLLGDALRKRLTPGSSVHRRNFRQFRLTCTTVDFGIADPRATQKVDFNFPDFLSLNKRESA